MIVTGCLGLIGTITQRQYKLKRHIGNWARPCILTETWETQTQNRISLKLQGLTKLFRIQSQKKEYDYYLDHPEEMMMNKMKYYTRVYATKSDWKLVVLSILIGISGLQYVLQSKMHKQQLERIMKADTGLQVKVKRLAKERFDELQTAKGTISPSRKSKKKKASKEEEQKLLEIERQVADELAEQVQVEGSFKKPEIRDIIIVKILMLPYTLPMFVLRKGTWFVKHTVLKQPLTEEEKMYLLTSSLYRSEESLRQQYSPEELDLLMDMEGWDPDNFRRFEDEVASRKAGKKRGKKNRDNYYE